jgi:hypothetical protein
MRKILVAILLSAVASSATSQSPAKSPSRDRVNVERLLRTLAHDSMEGRGTATRGEERASRFLAAEMKKIGLKPMGDDGYFQRVPMAMLVANRPGGVRPPAGCQAGTFTVAGDSVGSPLWKCTATAPAGATPATTPTVTFRVPPSPAAAVPRLTMLPSLAAYDTMPAASRRLARNVIGVIPGRDPKLKDEVILVMAHYDHLGIRGPGVNGDSIYNGADDDASGAVAVLEIARALKQGKGPKRTVVFATMTGEEMGLLGTRYFIANPTTPLSKVVAGFEVEMIGRPDSLAGGFGKAWLTGYDRSTMGDMLKANGIPIVPDPRPSQNFFQRSDNYAFAQMGIVAHTLSTYNLHTDYHRPSDDAERMDFDHMTAVIKAAAEAVRHLADGPTPAWHPGGKPTPPAPRAMP